MKKGMPPKTTGKRKLETRKTVIVIVAAGIFLAAVLLLNALTTMRGLHTSDCVLNMALIEKAMQKMQKEFAFQFALDQLGSDYILRCLPIYLVYGQAAFQQDAQGFIKVKPREEIQRFEPIGRKADYLTPRELTCPSGINYSLVPSANMPGLFDVECPKHGKLEQPNNDGRYTFSGNIHEFAVRNTPLGIEAVLHFPKTIPIDEQSVIIVPKVMPKPEPTK
jgi:hypothetical protein